MNRHEKELLRTMAQSEPTPSDEFRRSLARRLAIDEKPNNGYAGRWIFRFAASFSVVLLLFIVIGRKPQSQEITYITEKTQLQDSSAAATMSLETARINSSKQAISENNSDTASFPLKPTIVIQNEQRTQSTNNMAVYADSFGVLYDVRLARPSEDAKGDSISITIDGDTITALLQTNDDAVIDTTGTTPSHALFLTINDTNVMIRGFGRLSPEQLIAVAESLR